MSYGAGGLLLVLLLSHRLDVRGITMVSIPLAIAWQAAIPLVRRNYLRALERGLAGPVPTFPEDGTFLFGAAERRILFFALQSGDSQRALVALEQLRRTDVPGLRRALVMALDRPEPALRFAAIRSLEALEHTAAVPQLRVVACDDDPGARAAAVGALTRFLANDHPHEVAELPRSMWQRFLRQKWLHLPDPP